MRNMSFALTTRQIQDRTKTVTRRLAWEKLRAGDIVRAVVKAMGLKKGEKVEPLATLRVVDVRRESLHECTDEEAEKEGFPDMSGRDFVEMFCKHARCEPVTPVTRIEFEYVDPIPCPSCGKESTDEDDGHCWCEGCRIRFHRVEGGE